MFCGSALVLIGYAVVSVRMPSEFKLTYNLDEIAYRMSTFGDYNFFVSRRTMMKNLLARLESSRHSDSVNGPIQYAKIQLSSAAGKREADWEGSARSLYHSDITLRQFDRVKGRMIALTLLATGIACLLVPTVIGVLQVLFGFLD